MAADKTPNIKRSHSANRVSALARDMALSEISVAFYWRIVALFILISIATFVYWSSSARLDEVAIAHGEVAAGGALVPAQHLEGGIVSKVKVAEGSVVNEGDAIAVLNGAQAKAELAQLKRRQSSLVLKAERNRALAEDREPSFDKSPSGFMAELIIEEMNAYRAQKRNMETKILLINQQLVTVRAEISGLKGEIAVNKRLEKLAKSELDLFNKLKRTQAGSELKVIQAGLRYESVRVDGARLVGALKRVDKQVSELNAEREALIASMRSDAFENLVLTNAELVEVDKILDNLKDRVARLEIAAPAHGIVHSLKVKNVGEVVSAGGVIAHILPLDIPLNVEAKLQPRDVGYVSVGQSVELKFETFDFTRYGSIKGTVKSLSATTFRDDVSSRPYYKIIIEMSQRYVGDDPTRNSIQPGMVVEADIKTGEKTVLQYLLKPIYTNISEGLRER